MHVRNWEFGESSPAQPQMNCSGDAERRAEEEKRESLWQWQQTAAEVGGGGGGGREGKKVVAKEEQKASEGQPSPPWGTGVQNSPFFQNSESDEHRLRGCELGAISAIAEVGLVLAPFKSPLSDSVHQEEKEGACKGHKVIWVLPKKRTSGSKCHVPISPRALDCAKP